MCSGALGFSSDEPYHILGGGFTQWNWNRDNGFVDTSEALRRAFVRNPYMRLFVASGYFDLATPYFATVYTLSHLGLHPALADRMTTGEYAAGHMMYIDVGELAKLRRDVTTFIDQSLEKSDRPRPPSLRAEGAPMPTSDDVMQLAEACAARVSLPRRARRYPSFAEIEEQCADEYEDLLGLLHEDDVFAAADLERQEDLVRTVQIALPEHLQKLVDELVDNQAAQVWLQQEGAFHLGIAIGLRLAKLAPAALDEDEDEDEDDQLPDRADPLVASDFLRARRCRLSGGPAARCAARKTRSARLSAIASGEVQASDPGSSSRASAFGSDRSASARTMTICGVPEARVIRISSPAWTARCGFPEAPFTSTLPALHARCASDRVLKRQETSSHTSRRTSLDVGGSSDEDFNLAFGLQAIDERLPKRLALLLLEILLDLPGSLRERHGTSRSSFNHLDDVKAEGRFHDVADLARLQRERRALECRCCLPARHKPRSPPRCALPSCEY